MPLTCRMVGISRPRVIFLQINCRPRCRGTLLGVAHRLRRRGLDSKFQFPLAVFDEDGTVLGEDFADLFVEGILIVELKAAKSIADEHVAQLLGYLRASRIEHGLLISFGAQSFQLKKYVMSLDRHKPLADEGL